MGDMLRHLCKHQAALNAYNEGISANPRYLEIYKHKLYLLRFLRDEQEALLTEKELKELEKRREQNLKRRPR